MVNILRQNVYQTAYEWMAIAGVGLCVASVHVGQKALTGIGVGTTLLAGTLLIQNHFKNRLDGEEISFATRLVQDAERVNQEIRSKRPELYSEAIEVQVTEAVTSEETQPQVDGHYEKWLKLYAQHQDLQAQLEQLGQMVIDKQEEIEALKDKQAGIRREFDIKSMQLEDTYQTEFERMQQEIRVLKIGETEEIKKIRRETKKTVDEVIAEYQALMAVVEAKEAEIYRLSETLRKRISTTYFPGHSTSEILGNRLLDVLATNDIEIDAVKAETRKDGKHLVKLRARKPVEPVLVDRLAGQIQAVLGLETSPGISLKSGVFEFTLAFDTQVHREVVEKVTEEEISDYHEISELLDRETHNTVLIAGKQGTGKSVIGQYLALQASSVIAISPHLRVKGDKQDFPTAQARCGAGANYGNFAEDGTLLDRPKPVGSLDGSSIATALLSVMEDIDQRLSQYANGQSDFEAVDVFLDEVPAMQSNFRQEKVTRDLMQRYISKAMTEPRKVNLRNYILTQATTVAALGIPGLAALRDEVSWIRLGKTAIAHAQAVGLPAYQLQAMERQQRAWENPATRMETSPVAMLNDKPLALPKLSEMLSVIEDFRVKPDPEQDSKYQQALTMLSEGYTVAQVIQDVWNMKPSRSQKYREIKDKLTLEADKILGNMG